MSEQKTPIPTPRELAETIVSKFPVDAVDMDDLEEIEAIIKDYRNLLLRSASLRASAAIHKMKDIF